MIAIDRTHVPTLFSVFVLIQDQQIEFDDVLGLPASFLHNPHNTAKSSIELLYKAVTYQCALLIAPMAP